MLGILLLSLALPAKAAADTYCDGCPKPCYSPKHYWAPELWRIHSCLFCPKMNTVAPNRHPEIEPTFKADRWKCQPVDPQQSSVDFYFKR
jgi:hypothetical protein